MPEDKKEKVTPRPLPPHQLKIVLVEPEIPQNTGNIARLCVVTGAQLHLVRPLGFFLTGKHLKRSGMDYWDQVQLTVHDNLDALKLAWLGQPHWLASSKATQSIWDAQYSPQDWLVFGKETAGLDPAWIQSEPTRAIQIPMAPDARCLNLATAAGIVLYEALRQLR